MAQLTPAQRKKYDKIRNEKGPGAAKAFRDSIIGSSGEKKADAPKGNDTPKKDGKIGEAPVSDPNAIYGPQTNASSNGNTSSAPPASTSTGGSGGDIGPIAPTVSNDPIRKSVEDILKGGTAYGDELVSKYITPDSFQKIVAETSPEVQAYLKQLNDDMMTGRAFTKEEQEVLDMMRAGLGGYNSPEVQAMRESARQEINRDYKLQQAQALQNAARYQQRGGLANAMMQDAGQNRTLATGNLERDLLIKNADEAQRRKEGFANLVRTTEDARFGRQNATTQNYGNALYDEETARTGRQIYNSQQGTNRALASAGLALSGAGLYAGQYGNQEALNQARENAANEVRLREEESKAAQEQWKQFLRQQRRSDKQISDSSGF